MIFENTTTRFIVIAANVKALLQQKLQNLWNKYIPIPCIQVHCHLPIVRIEMSQAHQRMRN